MDILLPALFGLRCVLGPAGVLPNMNLIEDLADHADIDLWSMVPSLVDELGETADVLAKFTSSKFICASGGPVSPIAAGKVNDVVRILNLTGTTEGLFIGNLVVKREDWHWFAFHPYSGFEFKEIESGVYEHWIHRNEHSSLFQGIFHTFPAEKSYNFKDLYIRHPQGLNLWAFKGRSDDTVVLSNGYKISPLETEAFIATHPAIEGCLVIGSGKPQAGLLIELKDPAVSTNTEDLDSIWSTVEKANAQSVHKNQLHRDFITFAEVDKPFIRTDKRTVKRRATLDLYTEYIERFYNSRDDDAGDVKVDTSSINSITESIRNIFGDSLPGIAEASPDNDLFNLGLDSLLVFRVVKTIRAVTGLNELAPRYLYANPTLSKFSALLFRLAIEAQEKANASASDNTIDVNVTKMKKMIENHKARHSFKLNPFDYINPNHYMGLNFFLSIREGVTFEAVFENLRGGLRRTLDLIPGLDGKMMVRSPQEIGYKKGDLSVTIPHLPGALDGRQDHPRQLIYKDLSDILPSFDELREGGFLPSAVRDGLVLPDNTFPPLPADILVAQANFVKGGCILATNMNHCCLDGIGVMVALNAWAENCRYLQGDAAATCSWYDPESFNHNLPEILYEQEGHAKPIEEVDSGVWGFLPFLPPEKPQQSDATNVATPVVAGIDQAGYINNASWPLEAGNDQIQEKGITNSHHLDKTAASINPPKLNGDTTAQTNRIHWAEEDYLPPMASETNGGDTLRTVVVAPLTTIISSANAPTNEILPATITSDNEISMAEPSVDNRQDTPATTRNDKLPEPPPFPHRFVWPPPPVEHGLSTTLFLLRPEKVQELKDAVLGDPTAKGVTSISDIVQAFFWRSAIRARYHVATELRGETFTADEVSVLELPVDGRPYFSSLLPETYMGSMLILNRPNLPTKTLVSPKTSIGAIAAHLREAAARITTSLVHDAFTLLKSLPNYERFTTACMGLEGMHAMISNLMLFQTSEISFGGEFFGNGGSPESMRPQIERGHKRFRFLVIYPMRADGGVELVLGTNSEELSMLMRDEEFVRYAELVDSC